MNADNMLSTQVKTNLQRFKFALILSNQEKVKGNTSWNNFLAKNVEEVLHKVFLFAQTYKHGGQT